MRGLVEAWKRGDRVGFGSCFTARAHYLTGDRQHVHGRGAIEDLVPSEESERRIVIEGLMVTGVDAEAATASFRWEASDADGRRRRGAIVCVLVAEQGEWLIEDLQNTETRG
jgi:hypothetical protein